MVSDVIEYEGEKINLEWFEDTNFRSLKNVKQVYGVLFDSKGKIVIVKTKEGKAWSLPGGAPEKIDKDYIETLTREVDEEVDMDIEDFIPLGYIEFFYLKKTDEKFRQLRYVARVKRVKKPTIDPACGRILERKFISPSKFLKYCPWGTTGEAMITKAVKIWKENELPSRSKLRGKPQKGIYLKISIALS